MLWRTLEQQRIQSEQDGRWLEEEEKMVRSFIHSFIISIFLIS